MDALGNCALNSKSMKTPLPHQRPLSVVFAVRSAVPFTVLFKSLFIISAVCGLTFLSACKGKDPVVNPDSGLDPLTGPQSAEFEKILAGLGRPEELVRMITATNPTWGTSDVSLSQISAALPPADCTIDYNNSPTSTQQLSRTMTITDSRCPVQMSYKLEQQTPGKQFRFEGSFLFTSNTLANLNGIQGMSASWVGRVFKVNSAAENRYRWNLNGTGTLVTLENKTLEFTTSVDMTRRTVSRASSFYGTYQIRFTEAGKTIFLLTAEYSQSSENANRSKFKVNGVDISEEAFKGYQSKLGFLFGADSFTEAG